MAQYPSFIELSSLNGTTGFTMTAPSGSLGVSAGSAGDINGDGFEDLIVGANGSSGGYVLFGKAGGFASTLDLSTLNGTNGFFAGGDLSDGAGISVASAGDVNGDGFSDVIIGGPAASR